MSDRVILHCDCNSFFASVECCMRPELRNVPMAVCGSQEDRHGIVLAKNELAKKYGIKTAETVYSAKKKCPSLVICEPHHDKYAEYSERAYKIYSDYTDMIEPFGIDECWLDVTESTYLGTGVQIAEKIRHRIKDELGITVSIGVSFNKVFAKLGSDYKKPDAITVINRDNFENIVFPLPASDLLFVGKRTAAELTRLGIHTIGDVADASDELICSRLGKVGHMILKFARGEDDEPVCAKQEASKSVGNGTTFRHDITDFEQARTAIEYLSFEVASRLRAEGQMCSTVALTIKDPMLRTIQRQRPAPKVCDDSRMIAGTAYEILCDEWDEGMPIRMLTVTVSSLCAAEYMVEQLEFFAEDDTERRRKDSKREEVIDAIRKKYGKGAITNASIIGTDLGIYKDKKKSD